MTHSFVALNLDIIATAHKTPFAAILTSNLGIGCDWRCVSLPGACPSTIMKATAIIWSRKPTGTIHLMWHRGWTNIHTHSYRYVHTHTYIFAWKRLRKFAALQPQVTMRLSLTNILKGQLQWSAHYAVNYLPLIIRKLGFRCRDGKGLIGLSFGNINLPCLTSYIDTW